MQRLSPSSSPPSPNHRWQAPAFGHTRIKETALFHLTSSSPDDVVDQAAEERLRLQVGVVLLGLLLADVLELHRAEVVAARLEAGDDLADEAALDAVGLDHDEGGLHFLVFGGQVGGEKERKKAKEERK